MRPEQDEQAAVAVPDADPTRPEPVNRERLLMLLSDEEIARVSTVESASQLDDGEEYLDLEQLEQGVQRHVQTSAFTGRLVPRRAVRPETWSAILEWLARSPATPRPGA